MAKRKKSDLRRINQFDTLSVHAGIKSDPLTGAVMTPIYATSTFAQEIRLVKIRGMNIQDLKIQLVKF